MQYRKFGRLDWMASALGFGAMRLPLDGPDQADVNVAEAVKMIRYAIDQGVNYVDTGYPYHKGVSERVVGLALRDGYRQKAKLTTKLLVRLVETAADFDRLLNEQLERLQVESLDFYLLHGLTGQSWRRVRELGVLSWAERRMAQDRFNHLGFSFHDDYEAFKEIVDGYDHWALAQVQYNYMDTENQAGRKGVEYAAGKGLAVVVMEPLRGGRLAKEPPEAVARAWATAARPRSRAEWGLLWVWDQPEVSLVLSGMSTMEQVVENVAIAGRSRPGLLDAGDLALIARVKDAFNSLRPVPCTRCGYCQPCPNGVDIPSIFRIYDEAMMYQNLPNGRLVYGSPMGIDQETRADRCLDCGQCVEACPQKIAIPDWLKKIHATLK
jgi:predicted aldo/keto reductase-like oxidoreductase